MRRRLLFILLAIVAGIVLLVVALPLWLGVAAKMAGASRGLTFAGYERIGYSRFVLRDVEYRRPALRVTASRVEADTPLLWWWHRTQGRPEKILAGDWRVEVEKSAATPARPATAGGWVPLRRQLQRIATELERWLPAADVGPGVVRWPGGELSLSAAKWARRELRVDNLAFRNFRADATVAFAGNDELRVAVRMKDDTAKLDLVSRGAEVSGEGALWQQPAKITARFADTGWLPAEAALQAPSWSIPAARAKLGEAYATVHGGGRIEWQAGRFTADVNVRGDPLPGKAAPPLQIAVQGDGDPAAFTVRSLNVSLPGVTAQLSEAVTIERSGKIRGSGARFTLDADLAKLPWFSVGGRLQGEATLASGVTASPVVEFAVNANDLRAREVALTAVAARGRLEWPRLEIGEGSISGGEGERVTVRGGWDFRAKQVIDAKVDGQVRRQSLARWLPKQPEFDLVTINAAAQGELDRVEHRGTIAAAQVKVGGINPLDIAAEWSGRGTTVESFKAEAKVGGTSVTSAGKADLSSVTLSALDFQQSRTSRLRLATPAVLRWKPRLQVEGLKLVGPEGSLTLAATAGESGRVEVAAHNVSAKWFADLVTLPGPTWTVHLLALIGTWDRGPMAFTLTGGGGLEIGEGRTASVNFAAEGDRRGMRIQALRATQENNNVINATGQLPITFSPGGGALIRIDPNGALQLDAAVEPNSEFWQKLATISGVDLKDPRAAANLSGTWRQPQGTASVRAARLTIDPKRIARPLPAIEALEIQVTGDRGGVTLSTFSFNVEGQAVKAQGRLPVPEGQWDGLFKAPLEAARRGANLRVQVPDAEVANFIRFLPAVLAPKGRLQADMQYKAGGIEGYLKLQDAASRPLGPLGVLQEVNAEIAMSGRKFALRGVTAKSGGQPVTLNGTIEVPESGMPRFDLSLRGENLPFVRQTGLLLRGDLDLKLQSPDNGQPRLSGNVRLRDSLFLSDVRAFLPKGGASPTRRPPYFAVETPPVNAWTLAVDVTGERFLRLRTPVFTGVASARFRLGGTLGEPRAIGEIAIDEGNVRMPFASFAVTQGSIRLTEADPYEPAVYLRGTGRRYGYDVTMEIDGTASQPNAVFTSSPPLDSEQVLLMVMTGAAPSNEISKSATQRMANIGVFLGQSLLGSLGSDAAEADRWSFASGEKISRQGKETYDIEYKLSDRWTLTGEYNEFDEYNAGVKWRALRGKRAGEKDDAKK